MAWNPSPEVAVARDAAKRLKADRCVVLYTTAEGKIGYASYGETKSLCAESRRLGDLLYKHAHEYFRYE